MNVEQLTKIMKKNIEEINIVLKKENSILKYIEKINLEYERPYCVLPDIESENGNTFVLLGIVSNNLKKYGYKLESEEIINNFTKKKYKEIYIEIYRLLNIEDAIKKINVEGEDFFKKRETPQSVYNIKEFINIEKINLEKIKEMYNNKYDFSKKNCYGRSLLSYLNDLEAIEFLVEKNKTNKWFNLCDIDNLNSTFLHNKKPESMLYLLEEIYKENKSLTKLYLNGENIFKNFPLNSFVNDINVEISNELKLYKNNKKDLKKIEKILKKLKELTKYNESVFEVYQNGLNILEKELNKEDFILIKNNLITELIEKKIENKDSSIINKKLKKI